RRQLHAVVGPSSPQPDWNGIRRSNNSCNDTYRAFGSFTRHLMHTASRSRSTLGFTFRGASGISWSTRIAVATALSPAKGGLAVNISYIKAPTQYARLASMLASVPDRHSGATRAMGCRFGGFPKVSLAQKADSFGTFSSVRKTDFGERLKGVIP